MTEVESLFCLLRRHRNARLAGRVVLVPERLERELPWGGGGSGHR